MSLKNGTKTTGGVRNAVSVLAVVSVPVQRGLGYETVECKRP